MIASADFAVPFRDWLSTDDTAQPGQEEPAKFTYTWSDRPVDANHAVMRDYPSAW
jgi:hypothetical protein